MLGYRLLVQVLADFPFQGGADLSEQAADPVAGRGGLPGQVNIGPGKHP